MTVILNPDAGTVSKADEISAKITEAFGEAGVHPEIARVDENHDIVTIAKQAAAGTHETIVAGGGDGTISAVAAELAGGGKTLGVLPLGTLNHFAKDLKIPLDLADAVKTITTGRTISVDLAEVNGRIFVNNSSLGIYPVIVSSREKQQQQLARGKWPAFLWATLHALRRFPFLELRITVEGERLARRTAFLFVGNNEYEIAGLNLGGRTCLDAGKLGLYLTRRTGRIGLFRLALRALFGRVKQARDFDAFCVEEALIESHKTRLLVATDGEVRRMNAPLHYKTRPGALRVRVPQSQAR